MVNIEGFYLFAPLVDNTRDQVAKFGEISDDALTYARDKAYVVNTEVAEQTTMIGFYSVKDDDVIDIPSTYLTPILQVGQYLLNRALNGDLATEPDRIVGNLQAEFRDVVSNVALGTVEEDADSRLRLPQWIRFTLAGEEDNVIRIWLADQAFRSQYSHYDIEILPPLQNLDDFFADPLKVKDRILQVGMGERLQWAQQRRGAYPYTLLQSQQYLYYDYEDTTFSVPTDWLILLYGRAGNNHDLIRQKIVEYVLANSSHTREEWAQIFPDLFVTTEFVITPFWHRYSVPNRELQAGIYSPTMNLQDLTELLQETVQGEQYTPEWIAAQGEMSLVQYKSLAFGVVGNPQNRDKVYRFSQKFRDYMVIPNATADFNRMTPRTQEFIQLLDLMIREAERASDTTTVPSKLSRFSRRGITYIAGTFENISYLVVTKRSLPRDTGVY